jgi:hypothetical protein
MINSDNFRVSRDDARSKLDPEAAGDSFGYYIDFANGWESYRSPEETLIYLGIHKTHEGQFPQVRMELGRFSPEELDWARRYLEFYDRVGRLISSTSHRPELQFDIAETAVDWRVIRQFVQLPARIIDYGAGCGRQCVSAFLHNPDNIYTAIDSTLAAYTVQNIVFSFLSALRARRTFVDFLDLQLAGEAFPDIRAASPGDIYHFPAWFDHAHLPQRFYDVMFASHVHGELSASDFRRLIAVARHCLADEGVLYVRSELAIPFPKGYFESLDLHGLDIVDVLAAEGIVPVYCSYQSAFQTTVFARVGSSHYRKAKNSSAPECQFVDLRRAMETTVLAGRHYAQMQLRRIAAEGTRVVLSGRGFDMFESLITPFLDRIPNKLVLDYGEDLSSPRVAERIRQFGPEAVVAAAPNFFQVADQIRAAAGGDFAITLHHVMPMCYSYRQLPNAPEPALLKPLYVAGDIDANRGEPRRVFVPDGGELLGTPVLATGGVGVR